MAAEAFGLSEDVIPIAACEPEEWFVVFHRETTRPWLGWLACGRFKHVSLAGFVERSGCWVFIDWHVGRMRIHLVSNHEADAFLAWFVGNRDVLRIRAPEDSRTMRLRLAVPAMWCVPAVSHVLGLKTCALRPDALYRHCLAAGAMRIGAATDEFSRR